MAQPGSTIGELVVIALKAENLPSCMPNGKQDPFCIFKLGSVAKKTKVDQNGGQTPIWDDQINLPVPAGATRLFVQIFNRQASQENLISEGHVDLQEVLRKGEHDGFFPLVMNGRKAGQIYLELTFYTGQAHVQQHQYPAPQIRQYANRPPPPSSYHPAPMNHRPPPQPRPYPGPPPSHARPPPSMGHVHPARQPMPPPLNQPVRYPSTPTNPSPVISSPYQPPPTAPASNVIPSPFQPLPRPPVNNGFPPRPMYSQPPPQPQPQPYVTAPPHLQHHPSFNGGPPSHYSPRPPPPQQRQSFPNPRPHPLPPQQAYPNRPYSQQQQQQHPPHPQSGYPPY